MSIAELLPHQRVAVAFALARRRAYLALDPGLGKTAVAAHVAAAHGMRTVYISPPFLVRNVEAQFNMWAPRLKVGVYGQAGSFDVLIVPDSLLARRQEISLDLQLFTRGDHSLLVVDEAHRFKNGSSQRTAKLFGKKYGVGIVDIFSHRLYMSGTPIPNRPMELYALLAKEAPETIDWMTEFEYGRKFCAGFKTHFGWDFSGASNVVELKDRVQGTRWPFMLRQRKALLKLPPKIEEVFIMSEDMSPQLAALDKRVSAAYGTDDGVLKQRLAAAADVEGEALHLATYRRLLGVAKVKPAAEYVANRLEECHESLLVFAYHKEVVQLLAIALAKFNPLVIDGDTPKKIRQDLVDEFQKNKSRRLFIGNYHAMGVGFTMTKATRVAMVEYDWSPGVNDQASDRTHRIGQNQTVLVQYFVFKNSLDKRQIQAILTKRNATEQI